MITSRLVVILLVLSLVLVAARASVFLYVPVSVNASASEPVLRVWEPLHEQVTYTIGPNQTSIATSVNLSTLEQLVSNQDFNASLDAWACGGNQSIYCKWLPSDTGASGGVLWINGTIATRSPGLVPKYAYQIFMVPEPTSSLTIIARYALPVVPQGYLDYNLFIAALFWWNGSAFVLINFTYTTITQTTTYTTISLSMTPNRTMVPGEIYLLLAGYGNYVGSLWGIINGWARGGVDFRLDWVNLNYTSTRLMYGGQIMRLNVTQPVYARLYLTAYADNGSRVNGSIYFFNGTTITRVAVISNGSVIASGSSFLLLEPSGDQYNASAWVWLEVNTTSTTGNLTLIGSIEYTNGAYYVFYPFTIRVNP